MKISTQHLEALRDKLMATQSQLDDQRKAEEAAHEARLAMEGRVRGLTAAFDICAWTYAIGSELSEGQVSGFPVEAQKAIGYEPTES